MVQLSLLLKVPCGIGDAGWRVPCLTNWFELARVPAKYRNVDFSSVRRTNGLTEVRRHTHPQTPTKTQLRATTAPTESVLPPSSVVHFQYIERFVASNNTHSLTHTVTLKYDAPPSIPRSGVDLVAPVHGQYGGGSGPAQYNYQ